MSPQRRLIGLFRDLRPHATLARPRGMRMLSCHDMDRIGLGCGG